MLAGATAVQIGTASYWIQCSTEKIVDELRTGALNTTSAAGRPDGGLITSRIRFSNRYRQAPSNRAHHEITYELITGVDRVELYRLLTEKRVGQLAPWLQTQPNGQPRSSFRKGQYSTVAIAMIFPNTAAESKLATSDMPYIGPALFCISASLALSLGVVAHQDHPRAANSSGDTTGSQSP